jgi:carboxypeptidase D
LYVEQPVGTGYSLGEPNIKVRVPGLYLPSSNSLHHQDENDLAEQLVGFFQQFLEVFKEMKGKKFYLTGESVRRERLTQFDPRC